MKSNDDRLTEIFFGWKSIFIRKCSNATEIKVNKSSWIKLSFELWKQLSKICRIVYQIKFEIHQRIFVGILHNQMFINLDKSSHFPDKDQFLRITLFRPF